MACSHVCVTVMTKQHVPGSNRLFWLLKSISFAARSRQLDIDVTFLMGVSDWTICFLFWPSPKGRGVTSCSRVHDHFDGCIKKLARAYHFSLASLYFVRLLSEVLHQQHTPLLPAAALHWRNRSSELKLPRDESCFSNSLHILVLSSLLSEHWW